jgi:hypothetical protein
MDVHGGTMIETSVDVDRETNILIGRILASIGVVIGLALMVLALWAWTAAPSLASHGSNPQTLRWSLRCFAVAAGAGAQLLLLVFVAGLLFRRDVITDVLRICAALVCCIALVSAVALALAGR